MIRRGLLLSTIGVVLRIAGGVRWSRAIVESLRFGASGQIIRRSNSRAGLLLGLDVMAGSYVPSNGPFVTCGINTANRGLPDDSYSGTAGSELPELHRVLTPLYVKTVVQAAKSAAWRAR